MEKSVVDPWHFGTDPDPGIRASNHWVLLFSSLTFKTPTKNYFFLLITLWRYIYIIFLGLKVIKKSQNTVEIKIFLAIFAWW